MLVDVPLDKAHTVVNHKAFMLYGVPDTADGGKALVLLEATGVAHVYDLSAAGVAKLHEATRPAPAGQDPGAETLQTNGSRFEAAEAERAARARRTAEQLGALPPTPLQAGTFPDTDAEPPPEAG